MAEMTGIFGIMNGTTWVLVAPTLPLTIRPESAGATATPEFTPEQTARFWDKVDRSAGDDDCWLWVGSTDHRGYGGVRVNRVLYKAHRLAWALVHGWESIEGLFTRHPELIPRGSVQGSAKLTEAQIPVIRQLHRNGVPPGEIAQQFGVHRRTISDILNRKTWTHVD
jgi:hypothetical protein